jgi:hypothetical protein
MSTMFSTEFPALQHSEQQHDLLSHLYREIGILAVAAALDIIHKPSETPAARGEDYPLPAILRADDLAA